jgi:hypothetical protein
MKGEKRKKASFQILARFPGAFPQKPAESHYGKKVERW